MIIDSLNTKKLILLKRINRNMMYQNFPRATGRIFISSGDDGRWKNERTKGLDEQQRSFPPRSMNRARRKEFEEARANSTNFLTPLSFQVIRTCLAFLGEKELFPRWCYSYENQPRANISTIYRAHLSFNSVNSTPRFVRFFLRGRSLKNWTRWKLIKGKKRIEFCVVDENCFEVLFQVSLNETRRSF